MGTSKRWTTAGLKLALLLVAITAPAAHAFDLQGHRGARGLAPENTLVGFRTALALGVTTLETDLALTQDGILVLSHDPLLNPALTRDAAGRWIATAGPPISQLDSKTLASYDVGRLNPALPYAAQWPLQVPVDGERIPHLAQLFDLARAAKSASGRPVRFNIETKITPTGSVESPAPEAMVLTLAATIAANGMSERVTIQSFDWRSLLAVRKFAPTLETACLTIESDGMNTVRPDASGASPWHAGLKAAEHGNSIVQLAQAAGCRVWSPFWRNLTPALLAEAHARGLRVVPWTINNEVDIARVINLGVDGLITDYPDRALRLLQARGIAID